MTKAEILKIFRESHASSTSHRKNILVLKRIYNSLSFDEFADMICTLLRCCFCMDASPHANDVHADRILDFVAKFCTELYQQDDTLHLPFFSKIIQFALQYQDVRLDQCRQNACYFLGLMLKHQDLNLDNDLCDQIQVAMLDRLSDSRSSVQLKAIAVLVRLQEPYNSDCPVVRAFTEALLSKHASVRREVLGVIAPTPYTFGRIMDRTRDVDSSVRTVAFQRCAAIGPRHFRIVHRQAILRRGFGDSNEIVRAHFESCLLIKWLQDAYAGDLIQFIHAIKLDASEQDVVETERIVEKLILYFCRTLSLEELLLPLQLDENTQLVCDESSLTFELALYYGGVMSHLRTVLPDDGDKQYWPALTNLCNFIIRYMSYKLGCENSDNTHPTLATTPLIPQYWIRLEAESTLLIFLRMIEQYDLSDSVCRRNVFNMCMSSLSKYTFTKRVTKKWLQLWYRSSSSDISIFTNDVCRLLAEIAENAVSSKCRALTERELIQKNFRLAEIKMKMTQWDMELEEAVCAKDFARATMIQNEVLLLQRENEKVQKYYNDLCFSNNQQSDDNGAATLEPNFNDNLSDDKILARCLDILNSLLELKEMCQMTSCLMNCKLNFVVPHLAISKRDLITARLLNCISLYSLIDSDTAKEFINVVTMPMLSHGCSVDFSKEITAVSVAATNDIIREYGLELLFNDTVAPQRTPASLEDMANISLTSSAVQRKRMLYRNETTIMPVKPPLSFEMYMNILLDMLDDENNEILEMAAQSLGKLCIDGYPITVALLSRILIKWFNPLTGKADSRLQVMIGTLIHSYAKISSHSREVFEGAVIPTLQQIVNAPRISPLADIDVDDVVKFFAFILNVNLSNVVNLNRITILNFCCQMSSANNTDSYFSTNPDSRLVVYIAKLLSKLSIYTDSMHANQTTEELIAQLRITRHDIGMNRPACRYLDKLLAQLRSVCISGQDLMHNTSKQQENCSTRVGNTTSLECSSSASNEAITHINYGSTESIHPPRSKRLRNSCTSLTARRYTAMCLRSRPSKLINDITNN